ncbi:hypothetical protein HMPREF9514_00132 [Enterococcus faecalis TX0855]|uniref:Uncharacterized protein n=1 Tax=Enterococcus faecalis TaxID=1351 RepID=F6KLQ2_ENTFL|nr:hypothetical protein pLG2-0033 [Enterococcus faecalis]EEU81187.1 predicted protein [Enterococcus faecalis D6]EFM66166.1 hypothetical protein HMPREF9509_02613 [Enterococcus faecalis TX0411]EFM80936.1 hypothetical protein HMPREF9514_00132 [Enterococcus faecalis TX0855]EFU07543.1 hypothetical protein HMPREF9516_02882 [Enterococcus faecalis TX1302]EGG58472.1 hypothetical protein HMPREF9520_01204 [Enterococcus faecalis TX1467]EJU84633.1 hypothetical protein HMPREF1327_03100 [Enterococcus faecal
MVSKYHRISIKCTNRQSLFVSLKKSFGTTCRNTFSAFKSSKFWWRI